MSIALDSPGRAPGAAAPPSAFGHRLAPAGDPLEGAAFDALYQARIEPELVKREAERRAAMRSFFVILAGVGVLVFLENLLTKSFTNGASQWVDPRIMIPTILIGIVVAYLPLANVAKRAKVSVICALCEPLGVSYSPSLAQAPSFDNFLALKLLPHPTSTAFSDAFSGQRGDADFTTCEAVLTQGSGKSRTVVFRGQLFRLVTPRRLASTTVVLRNTGWLKAFECPKGLESVGLEDPTFNQSFAVFASDQVESREILTPSFMQQLVDLETSYSGGHIRCAFSESELLIALECANSFEIGGMFSSLVQRSRVEGIARNIEQVFKMIDEFRGA